MSSAPQPGSGAPSLGPGDRIPPAPRPEHGLGWDDVTPTAWRAFEAPDPTKEQPDD